MYSETSPGYGAFFPGSMILEPITAIPTVEMVEAAEPAHETLALMVAYSRGFRIGASPTTTTALTH